jgi:hypothetical protein
MFLLYMYKLDGLKTILFMIYFESSSIIKLKSYKILSTFFQTYLVYLINMYQK